MGALDSFFFSSLGVHLFTESINVIPRVFFVFKMVEREDPGI